MLKILCITSFSNVYANDLEQKLLLLFDVDHEIIEGSFKYPLSTTLVGELIAFAHNDYVNIEYQ